jgi:hypothetical protein
VQALEPRFLPKEPNFGRRAAAQASDIASTFAVRRRRWLSRKTAKTAQKTVKNLSATAESLRKTNVVRPSTLPFGQAQDEVHL